MVSSKVTPCSCYSGRFFREKNKLQDTQYLSAKISFSENSLFWSCFSIVALFFRGLSTNLLTSNTSNTILSPFWSVKKFASCPACINGERLRRFTKGENSFCLNELLFIQRKFWHGAFTEHDYQHRFTTKQKFPSAYSMIYIVYLAVSFYSYYLFRKISNASMKFFYEIKTLEFFIQLFPSNRSMKLKHWDFT